MIFILLGIWHTQNRDQGAIKIGAVLILSGEQASQGASSKQGIDLAVKEINAKGGVLGRPLEIVYQDNKDSEPKEAVNAFHNLINQGVTLIIGPNQTPSGSAVAPLAQKHNALLVAPSIGSEKFAQESSHTFNIRPADQGATFELAEYLYQKGYKRVAVFGSQQEWEKQQAEYFKGKFESLGGTITDLELPLASNKDLRTEALKIKDSKPEAIIFTNYGETSYAARRLREIGVKVPFYSVLIDEVGIKNALGALEGTIFVTTYTPSPAFLEKFKEEYGVEANFPADTAYDAVYVLAEAIKRAGTTETKEVVKAFTTIKDWKGEAGHIVFDQDGNVSRPSAFFIVKGDTVAPYKK